MKKSISYFLLLIVTLGSCVPEPLPLEIDQLEEKPVIWSQVIGENGAILYFGRTFSALEFSDTEDTASADFLNELLVQNAEIILRGAGDVDTLFPLTNGLFLTLNATLIPGETYTITARDLDKGLSTSASAVMMPQVAIDTVTFQSIDTNTYNLRVRFTDPSGPNWYAIHFYSSYNDPLEIQDPLESTGVVRTVILSDIEYNTASIALNQELDFLESDTVYVSLNNIDEGFYNYLQQRSRGGNLFSQAISEPITYPTNVLDGYGIFSLYRPSVKTVILEN
ncbi:MAG: hypothetical protein RLZZ77_1470 [Bacteroidota bacterium]|jgi:hypothetical protein